MKPVLKALGMFLLWNLVVGFFLLFADPVVGLPVSLALYALLLWGYLLRPARGEDRTRRWASLRLRRLEGSTRTWAIISVPVMLLLSWALGDVYTRLVPVPTESLNPFEELLSTADGRLMISIFAIAVAPIVEEFTFRGLIQRELERKHGAVVGIVGSAGLFALVHLLPWVFPLHFFLGVAFGFAVWATRSIWTGVILHAANNTAAMIGFGASGQEPAPTGTLWEFGVTADLWISLGALLVATAAAAWTAGKLLEVRRRTGLPSTSAPAYVR